MGRRGRAEAAAGDERGRIGLGGDVVELAERARAGVGHQLRRAWPELGRSAGLRVPLHGREQALRIAAQQGGKGGEAGRNAAGGVLGVSAASARKSTTSAPTGPQARMASAPTAAIAPGGSWKEKQARMPRPSGGCALFEPFPSETGEATGRGHEGDRGRGPERGDRPTEGDQVAAGRGGHRDHAGEALDVVRGRAVVPDDRARPGRGDRAR